MKSNVKCIIEEIKNRPIQFNAPFGNILFSNGISDILDKYIKKLTQRKYLSKIEVVPYRAIPIIAADILDNLIVTNGEGHINYLRGLFTRSASKLNYLDRDVHSRFRVEDTCFKYNTLFYNHCFQKILNFFHFLFLLLQLNSEISVSNKKPYIFLCLFPDILY